MDVVRKPTEHRSQGQHPVLDFDPPLYALAKQIQWKWPETHGEGKLVVISGGLHVEMAALTTIGDWLKGSGGTQALAQAQIATAGTADSPFFGPLTSHAQEGHTRSQRPPFTFFNNVHTIIIE